MSYDKTSLFLLLLLEPWPTLSVLIRLLDTSLCLSFFLFNLSRASERASERTDTALSIVSQIGIFSSSQFRPASIFAMP